MATWNSLSDVGSNIGIGIENAPVNKRSSEGVTRVLPRSSRRVNGGILKSIRRKLPWNRRPGTTNHEPNHDAYSEDSDSALSVSKGAVKPKSKPRAKVCPMPSPLRALRRDNVPQEGLYVHRGEPRGTSSAPVSPPTASATANLMRSNSQSANLPQSDSQTANLLMSDSSPNYADPAGLRSDSLAALTCTDYVSATEPELYGSLRSRGSLTAELYRLGRYGWYWGAITRFEAEEKLHGQSDGAFLVRDSSDDRYLLSLSFRSFGKTLHTRIEHCNGSFSFYMNPSSEGFDSPVDLIEHSMSYSQSGIFCYSKARTPGAPSLPVRLTKPVSRFSQVRSLQYLCRCVIRLNTRVDHIRRLPLPDSVIEYIEARLH